MKIHIISNSLRLNSGFSIVARHVANGLKKLGHDITFTGMQTAYVSEFNYCIDVLPIQVNYIDDMTQFMMTLNRIQPDVVLAIFQMDMGTNNPFTKVFPKTVCLLPDSSILTLDRGVQKIKDIKIGDKVLTHKGKFMRVSLVMSREYLGDMVKIIPHKLKIPIALTPEHEVLAVKTSPCIGDSGVYRCRPGAKCYRIIDGYQRKRCKYIYGEEPWRKYKTQWIAVKDLCVGDWVVYPKANEREIDIEKIKILDYIEDSLDITGDEYGDSTLQTDIFGGFIDKTIKIRGNYNSVRIPSTISLDKGFLRLCGYFIAEGGIIYDDDKQSYHTYFGFNVEETEYINDVKNLMKTYFGLDVTCERKDKNSNGYSLIYANRILANLFTNLFAPEEYQTKKGRGRKSNIVRIPPEFLNLPLAKLREMVKAIWRGDGSYYKSSENCNKNSYEYSISTTSETLAWQLTYILSRFNILCSIDLKYPKKENHALAYDVSITGEDIVLFEKIINEKNLYRESYKQVNKYIRGNRFFYLPIKNIDIIRYNGQVWNLEIEEDNSYVSTIAVHNCYCPIEGKNIPHDMANDLLQIKMHGGAVVAQCRYGQSEMKLALGGLDVPYIYHGHDPDIFKRLDLKKVDDIRYCYYNTEDGKVNSDPMSLHAKGCYDCQLNNKEQTNCPYYKEEDVSILRFINGKWTEESIPITDLPNITKNKTVFGFVGQNIGIRKRIERLLKAYSIFIKDSRQFKDRTIIHLHTKPIAIDGVNLIKVIQDLGIQDNIIFSYGTHRSSGWTEQAINILFNTFDINTSASSSEGFGLPILESMACGKLNIGPNCSSFTELIGEDPKTRRGLLASIIDWQMIQDGSVRALVNEKDLANQMQTIYQSEELRKTLSKNAIKFAQDYTWEKIVLQWDQLLKTI